MSEKVELEKLHENKIKKITLRIPWKAWVILRNFCTDNDTSQNAQILRMIETLKK